MNRPIDALRLNHFNDKEESDASVQMRGESNLGNFTYFVYINLSAITVSKALTLGES